MNLHFGKDCFHIHPLPSHRLCQYIQEYSGMWICSNHPYMFHHFHMGCSCIHFGIVQYLDKNFTKYYCEQKYGVLLFLCCSIHIVTIGWFSSKYQGHKQINWTCCHQLPKSLPKIIENWKSFSTYLHRSAVHTAGGCVSGVLTWAAMCNCRWLLRLSNISTTNTKDIRWRVGNRFWVTAQFYSVLNWIEIVF